MASDDAPPRYFVNAPVDAFVIGGLSIVTWLVFRFGPAATATSTVVTLTPLLTWGVSYPHFASTSYRLYSSPEAVRRHPFTAFAIPALFALAVVASFASPDRVAPAFVKLYQLWSPYHFSGQTIGLTVLYARRCGFPLDRQLRRALTAVVYLTFLYSAARLDVGVRTGRFFGVSYPSLQLPAWVPDVLAVATWIAVAAVVFVLLRRAVSRVVPVPWIVLLPAVTQCVWFATARIGTYANLVFFFHSLQYLYVSWHLQLRLAVEREPGGGSVPFVWRESARWMAYNVAGAAVFFWLLPLVGARFGRPLGFSTAVVLVAIQTHHFFVDGVIWRQRDPLVRAPLSSSLAEVSGHRPVPTIVVPA